MKRVIRCKAWLSLFLLVLLAAAAAAQAPQGHADGPEQNLPAFLTAKPIAEDPSDDELRKLLKARYNEAVGEVNALYAMYLAGRSDMDLFADAGQRLVQAGLELYDNPSDKIALLTQYVELTKGLESLAQARHDAGQAIISDLHRARYQRLTAEIQLLRAKREANRAKEK
jgi:hypothetical protein